MSLHPTDQLLALVEQEAQKQGLDPATARAILLSENSGYDDRGKLRTRPQVDTETVSNKNAYGIMQVIPSTAANLTRLGYFSGDSSTPEGQIRLGVAALKEMKDRGIERPTEMAVAYNGGERALADFRNGRSMNAETTTYLKKFVAHLGGNPMADSGTNTTREAYSTTTKEMSPGVRAAVQSRVDSANALHSDTRTQLQELTRGILSNTDEQIVALDKAAQADAAHISTEAVIKNATIDNQESILSAFGINLNSPENEITKRMEVIRSNSNERMQLSNQIGALDNESPLTNPVGWLLNQVKQYPLIQRHNAILNESNAAAGEIEQLQKMTSNQQRLQPAHIQSAINAESLAKVNQVLAAAGVEKSKLVGAAKARVAQMIMHIDESEGSNLRANIQWADMGTITSHEAFSDSNKTKEEDESLNNVNGVLATWGMPSFNKVTFKALSKETQERWIKMSQFKRTGSSPGEAVALLYDTYGGPGLSEINKNAPIAGKFLQEVVANGQSELDGLLVKAQTDLKLQNQLKHLKTPMDQMAFAIDHWAKRKEDELKNKNMSALPEDNPYKLKVDYVSTIKELEDNPLSKFIKEKKVQGIVVNDQLLLASAMADVSTGKKKVGEVAQYVQEFYKTGFDLQRRDSAAKLSGFKPLDTYPTILRLSSRTAEPVDLFNQQSIENFLVQQIVQGKVSGALDIGVQQPMRLPR